jgi:hypothetical protein
MPSPLVEQILGRTGVWRSLPVRCDSLNHVGYAPVRPGMRPRHKGGAMRLTTLLLIIIIVLLVLFFLSRRRGRL